MNMQLAQCQNNIDQICHFASIFAACAASCNTAAEGSSCAAASTHPAKSSNARAANLCNIGQPILMYAEDQRLYSLQCLYDLLAQRHAALAWIQHDTTIQSCCMLQIYAVYALQLC